MNHIESSFAGKNSWWRYVVMLAALLIVSNTVGVIPLLISVFIKSSSNPDIVAQLTTNPNDFSVLGMESNIFLIIMLFPFIAALVAFIVLVKPLNNRTLKMTINGTGKIRWQRFFVSALIWLMLSGVYLFVYMKLDPLNFTLNNTSFSLIYLAVISIIFIPFQAGFEEIIFRGYLMQGFAAVVRNRMFPLVMTSVLFALLHAFNPEVTEFGFFAMMPQYILFGLIFGIVTILDDGIEAAMGAHTANNVFLCIMVTSRSSALQTDAFYEQININPWTEFAGLIVMGALFIILLKIVFKWENFSLLSGNVEKGISGNIANPE